MWVDGEQMGTSWVNAAKHERRIDVTLIPGAGLIRRKKTGRKRISVLEKHLLSHGHGGDDAGFPARRKGVQLTPCWMR